MRTAQEVQGITFGPLIGQGAFGRCYCGTWQGASVAIKASRGISHAGGTGGWMSRVSVLAS